MPDHGHGHSLRVSQQVQCYIRVQNNRWPCTGCFPCISLRRPAKISSRTHSNTQSNSYIPYRHDKLFSTFQLEFTSDIRIVPLFFAFSRFLRDTIPIFLCQTLTGTYADALFYTLAGILYIRTYVRD